MSQIIVFLTLAIAIILFAWGRLRHDIVALIALFIVTLSGVISAENAFLGFGHPAVITVASVLIIGQAMERAGVVNLLGQLVSKLGDSRLIQITSLSVVTAIASAFMNNVGSLAIMMPVAIQLARKGKYSPSLVLMPLSFASLLGGMTTLIGTPPNIIISAIRADHTGEPFGMFHFAPVGIGVATAGVLFITFIGWRLLPQRTGNDSDDNIFKIEEYITEVKVVRGSNIRGMTIPEIREKIETEINILSMVRQKQRIQNPSPDEIMKVNDVLVIEADTQDLNEFLNKSGTRLVGGKKFRSDARGSRDIQFIEAVIMNDSPLVGDSAAGLSMRSRYGINLLAIARREKKFRKRLDNVLFKPGDVVLLQGRKMMLNDIIKSLKCLPVNKGGVRMDTTKNQKKALAIFGFSIIMVVSGLMPVQVAFTLAALSFVLSGLLPIREVYTSVDWPVIVLLGAMIPVGQALESSGGAVLIASKLLVAGNILPVWAMVAIVLVVTMFLSDIINNAATVVLMAPIGISIAQGINASIDPFLMAVAIGGSSAFLSPIGHQSNTLVMGPGGYKFSDYWRMGLPLEFLIVIIGVPLILYFWPL